MTRRQDFAKSGSLLCSLVLLGVATSAENADAQQAPAPQPAPVNREQELQNRVDQLERRVNELESSTVLSEPETIVKQIQVYVDENGNEFDEPGPGRRPVGPTSVSASIADKRLARSSTRRSRKRPAAAWPSASTQRSCRSTSSRTGGHDPGRRRCSTSSPLRISTSRPASHRTRFSSRTSSV